MEGRPPEDAHAPEPSGSGPPEPPGRWLPPKPPGPPPPAPPAQPPAPQAPAPPPPPPAQQFPPRPYPSQGHPYPPQPAVGWQPLPPQPPNNDAVAGFTCAVVGGALLFFSAGLSSILSLILGIVAIPYSRKGKRRIADGETMKHKDLANAGYVVGIVVVVLSIVATIAWILLIALVDWEEIDDGDDDPFDQDFQDQVVLRVLAAAVRLVC